jgi:hypothetical protein
MVKVIDGAKPWVFAYLTEDDFGEAIDYALRNENAYLRIDFEGLSPRSVDRFYVDPRISQLQHVHVVSAGKSLDSLVNFTGLRQISFAMPVGKFDFSCFPHLQQVGGVWTKGWSGLEKCHELLRFRVSQFKGTISDIPNLATLERIDLIQTTIVSLAGLEHATKLAVLEISHANKLRSIQAIAEVAATLNRLVFDKCKAIEDVGALRHLSNVTWLSITDCGQISSIDFLDGMDRLHTFITVGTKILSGDLKPVLDNKSLRHVAANNARDYRPALSVVLDEIRARSNVS